MKYILAIDQGTTGNRALLLDKKGTLIDSAYQEFKQIYPKPGWVEHNPEEIWSSVSKCVSRVIKRSGADSIHSIGITNQRETIVAWQKSTGKALYHAIVWQCRRTTDICTDIKQNKSWAKKIPKITGLPIDPYFSASKMKWLLENVPAIKKCAEQEDLCFGTTDSWLMWKFSGGKTFATDYSNASRTQLLHLEKLNWEPGLLDFFGIPLHTLPRIYPSMHEFTFTKKLPGIPEGILIGGVAGDQQAALFGQGCFDKGQCKNTYGTGSFLLMNTGDHRIHSKFGMISTLGASPDGGVIHVLEGAIFIAGAAIQWLRDGLGLVKNASESERWAQSLESNEGVYFVPALTGIGAPYWNPEARGIITGLTRGTNKAHLIRAGLEAMAYQTRDVLEAMQKDTGLTIQNLNIDGGAVANQFLCQFQADLLGRNVVRPSTLESTALGAAFLAGLCSGYWKNAEALLKTRKKSTIFKPRPNQVQMDVYYKGWKNAVKKCI